MGKLYDKNSIESLDPLQFTRLKPRCVCRGHYLFNPAINRNNF